jgi:acyl carrier protein
MRLGTRSWTASSRRAAATSHETAGRSTDGHHLVGWDDFTAELRHALERIHHEPPPVLTGATHLLDDIGLDSFGVLELVVELEESLGLTLEASEAEPTVGALFVQAGLGPA